MRYCSLGIALTDTLDDLISSNQIEPQLAMKILANFDKAIMDVMSDKVKARLSFKVCGLRRGSHPSSSSVLCFKLSVHPHHPSRA